MATYIVRVNTGSLTGASTNAKIYINIFGAYGETGEIELDTEKYNDFESGKLDSYVIESNNVGYISKISMRNDMTRKNPDWYLVSVEVMKGNVTTFFDYSQWLSTDEPVFRYVDL